MKNFFQKNGIMMLAAVTVVAVLLCVASALSSQPGFPQNAGGVIASPFRAVGSAVSGWFSSISQRFEDVEALQQENADLKRRTPSCSGSWIRPRSTARRTSGCGIC